MGLPAAIAELLFFEHKYRPLKGDVGFIGRQTTYLSQESLNHLGKKFGVAPEPGFAVELDQETRAAKLQKAQRRFITDRSLIRYFGGKFFSLDASDYEGADLVVDLSFPIAKEHYDRFDLIYNGSCLDNIFNPAEALRNISRLLRPGGRLVMIEHGSMFHGPYTIFSPGWFFDYFAANGYADCKVYVALFHESKDLHYVGWPIYHYTWRENLNGITPRVPRGMQIMLVVVAEKGRDSTNDAMPVQHQYRDKKYHDEIFRINAERILNAERPVYGQAPAGKPNRYLKIMRQIITGTDYTGYESRGVLGDNIPFAGL